MWQEATIVLIGILTLAYVGRKIYLLFAKPKDPGSPCSGCSGCALKEQIQNKNECPDTGRN